MSTEREKDIQIVCNAILNSDIRNTGDSGSGGMCPFCYKDCSWNCDISEVNHSLDCPYLVAKDLMTNL